MTLGASPPAPGGRRRLGLGTATFLVVASMVGTGVFTTTGFLVADLKNVSAVLLSWGLGGVLALSGALAYAELSAALPHNGGEYALLSRLFHPGVGFVSGFTSLVVGFSAPTAAAGLAFGEYLARVVGLRVSERGPFVVGAAVALVVVMSALHAVRVTVGSQVQNFFTAGKVALILLFIGAGLFLGDLGHLTADAGRGLLEATLSPALPVGLIYISFAYTGWNAAAYVAGEVRNPERNLPRALVGGTLLVTGLYLGLNAVFLGAAPPSELAGEVEVGHVAAAALFGEVGGRLLSALIALGLVSTVGAFVMTGPRIYAAIGEDYPRLAWLGRRTRFGAPVHAIALQTAIALVMVLSARFEALLAYVGVTLSVFAGLTVGGVFRVRRQKLTSSYRAPGHPATTLLFIALMIWMIVHAILERPAVSLAALGTLALGALVYAIVRTPR